MPIARLERAIRPEDLAPAIGTMCADDELASAFGLGALEARSGGGRHEGHLFAFIDEKGLLVEPDRLRLQGVSSRPGETAFVLARRPDGGGWRYLSIGRQTEASIWALPDVDVTTWQTWGEGREMSRRLPEGSLVRAQVAVGVVLALPEAERWIGDGRRARVLGRAARGGVRIDGGYGGFRERTVSLADIAWVIVASDHAAEEGGLLDEERVNRLRYLEGTPKGSTRWIDTGWAIALWNAVKGSVRAPVAGDSPLHRIRRSDGTPIGASFRVERIGEALTVVFESRGGTRGSDGQRNSDYAEGLELLLGRLADARMALDDVLVDSRETAKLALEERRVLVPGQPYPLVIDDPAELGRKLGAGQARVGRARGARGSGNRTRRIRLFLTGTSDESATELAGFLAGVKP